MVAAASVRDALDGAIPALAAAGCESPRLDAEVLIAEALGIERAELLSRPEREVSAPAGRRIGEWVRRRIAREPVAYILGRKGFRRIEVAVDRRVLIPRPETELLVEVALALPPGGRVHEVGTGSGAVALALVDERPDLVVSASDSSRDAVEVARGNALRLGLPLEVWAGRGLPEWRFDLVLANLPYVREDEWLWLQPEIVRYEPRAALVAGPEGLEAIRELAAQAPAGTRVALEHAHHQAEQVRALLDRPETHRDLAGRERVTVGWVR